MATKLTDHLKIDPKELEKLGCFDPILNVDSLFFIDPKSLSVATVPEFKGSYVKVRKRFQEVLNLLAASKTHNDLFWRKAYQHFPKGELENICIGYGFDNTGGRGMGPVLTDETLRTVKEFLDSGISDPALFELVGVFQKNVGCDMISDLLAKILLEEIWQYTDRVSKKVIPAQFLKSYRINGTTYRAYPNPYNEKPLLLLPAQLLQPLPVASDWSEVDIVCRQNMEVRKQFAKLIGATNWRRVMKKNKDMIKGALLSQPDATRDFLQTYQSKTPKEAYDFKNDPSAEYSWYDYSKEYGDKHPLSLSKTGGKPENVVKVVQAIAEKYKDLVENNGLNKALYNEKTNMPMHERQSQRLFYGVASCYCDANDLDISPETNSGKGPIDFKFSNGKKAKVLVEIKLSSNPSIDHGLNVQLKEYENAEKPYRSFLIVISVSNKPDYQKKLNRAVADKVKNSEPLPNIIYVNGKQKPSASKA